MQPDNASSTSPESVTPLGQSPRPGASALPVAHDYLHPITDEPKHHYNLRRMMIILGLIVISALVTVGLMIFFALQPVKQPAKKATTTTNSVQVDTLTAKQEIENTKVYFKGTEKAKSAIPLPVMAPGKAFYTVIPDVEPLTSIAGEITPDKSDTQLQSILKSIDYDKFSKLVLNDGANGTNYVAEFSRSDVICQVSVTKPADKNANHWFEVSCLDMAQYTEYATYQQTFASLYTPATSTATYYGFIGKPAPTAAKASGYNLLEIPVGIVIDNKMSATNVLAMYYQSPDGLWHYFKERTQGIILECEQYSTVELKSAYVGQPCRSLAKGTTLTVPPPRKN